MTYVVDLTALLISLFDIEPGDELTWTDLKKAYDDGSGSRQRIHRQICVDFKQDQQILDTEDFRSKYVELVKDAGPHPDGNRIEDRTRAEDARVPVLSPASATSVTSAMSATSAASARSSTPRSPRASSSFGRLLKTFSLEKR
jgi:hypothetical protein